MSYLIDSHCHLNFKAFKNDWREVAERAFSGGVRGIINVGSNYETSQRAVELACNFPLDNDKRNSQTFPLDKGEHKGVGVSQPFPLNKGEHKGVLPRLYAAIGLHPTHVKDEEFDTRKYQNLINDCHPDQRGGIPFPKCHCEESQLGDEAISGKPHLNPPLTKGRRRRGVVAIGETGIDLYHDSNTLVKQQEVFVKSIDLANKHHLPVIVHNRGAGQEVLEILLSNRPEYGGVMHFFSEDWSYAQKIFDMGLAISFTGAITLKSVENKTIDVIKKSPLDKIMVETDAPYVVPEPMKSSGVKRNEPAYVVEVAKKIAKIKGLDLDKVASQTTQNTTELFSLSS